MSQNEDSPVVVVKRDISSNAGAFMLGALLGAGVALLLAPRSGKETREQLKTRALEIRDAAGESLRAAQEEVGERLDQAGGKVRRRIESVREAVDAGRQAALDARSELGEKLATTKAAYAAASHAARQVMREDDHQDAEEFSGDTDQEPGAATG